MSSPLRPLMQNKTRNLEQKKNLDCDSNIQENLYQPKRSALCSRNSALRQRHQISSGSCMPRISYSWLLYFRKIKHSQKLSSQYSLRKTIDKSQSPNSYGRKQTWGNQYNFLVQYASISTHMQSKLKAQQLVREK